MMMCSLDQASAKPTSSAWIAARRIASGPALRPMWGRCIPIRILALSRVSSRKQGDAPRRHAQASRAASCAAARRAAEVRSVSGGQVGFSLGQLGALGASRFAQRHQLLVGVVGHSRVARLLGGAGLTEDAAKAVWVSAQHLLVFRQSRGGLVELEQ